MQCRAIAAMWFSSFLLKAFVNRVNRRIPVLIVRFCRSMYEVLMCFESGLPIPTFFSQPMHFAGL
jgi:hypothetical protein